MVTNEHEPSEQQPTAWLDPQLWNRAVVLDGEIVEPRPALAAAPSATCEPGGHDSQEITKYGEPHRAYLCRACGHRWTEPWPDAQP